MTQTVTFHPKQGIHIPAKLLRDAGFEEKKAYVIKINTPIINIIPERYEAEAEKDWLDEALETPEGKAFFQERIEEAERDIKKGRVYSVEEVFAEIKRARMSKK